MNPRRKGHDGERELAAALRRESLGIDVARNLSQSREGGHDLEVCGFAVEVKRAGVVTTGKVERWWEQAVRQAERADLVPALAYRQDRRPWAIRVPLVALRPDLPRGQTAEVGIDGFCSLVQLAGQGTLG